MRKPELTMSGRLICPAVNSPSTSPRSVAITAIVVGSKQQGRQLTHARQLADLDAARDHPGDGHLRVPLLPAPRPPPADATGAPPRRP